MRISVAICCHKAADEGTKHENNLQGTIPLNCSENRLLPEATGLASRGVSESGLCDPSLRQPPGGTQYLQGSGSGCAI